MRSQRLKADVDRKMKNLEIAEKEKKLVEVAGIQKELDKMVLDFRAKMLAIPSRMAVELADRKPIEIEKRLRDVVEEALRELANDSNTTEDSNTK